MRESEGKNSAIKGEKVYGCDREKLKLKEKFKKLWSSIWYFFTTHEIFWIFSISHNNYFSVPDSKLTLPDDASSRSWASQTLKEDDHFPTFWILTSLIFDMIVPCDQAD